MRDLVGEGATAGRWTSWIVSRRHHHLEEPIAELLGYSAHPAAGCLGHLIGVFRPWAMLSVAQRALNRLHHVPWTS